MTTFRTTTTCRDCGNQIPESLPADALCVRCRYPAKKKKADENDVPTQYDIACEQYAVAGYVSPAETIEDLLLDTGHFDLSQAELAARIFNGFTNQQNGGLHLEPVLAFLIADGATAQAIGERVLMLSYLLPMVHGRPLNSRELGARLVCSHTAAQKKVSKFKAVFIEDLHEIAGKSFQANHL